MRKILATPIQINSRLIHINPGYYFLLDKSSPWLTKGPPYFGLENSDISEPLKAGGLRTSGLATCVAIIVNTPTHIGLAHCDAFQVVPDLKDMLTLRTLNLRHGDSASVVFAYNPLWKRLSNALSWQTGAQNLANTMGISLDIQFYAVTHAFDMVGVNRNGDYFTLPKVNLDQIKSLLGVGLLTPASYIPAKGDWAETRFRDYFIDSRLRTESLDYENVHINRINLQCLPMPTSQTPAESENRLESQLHQWLRLIPTDTEAFFKILVPLIPLFMILMLDNSAKTLSCAPRFVFPEKP